MSKFVLGAGSTFEKASIVARTTGEIKASVGYGQISFEEGITDADKHDIISLLDFWQIPVLY